MPVPAVVVRFKGLTVKGKQVVQPSGPPQKGLLPKLKVGHAVKVLGSGSGGGTPGNCSPLLLLLVPALLPALPLPLLPPARLPLPQPRSSACTRLARVWHDVLYQGHGFSPPPATCPIGQTRKRGGGAPACFAECPHSLLCAGGQQVHGVTLGDQRSGVGGAARPDFIAASSRSLVP